MLLQLPSNLHYPITITKVQKRAGETVNLKEILFLYAYTTKVKQGDRYTDEETEVDKTFLAQFESTLEGTIKSWKVWDGDVINGPTDVCEVIEECTHSVQYLGMCTNCGKDMTEVQPGSNAGTERANIKATHDTDKLTISQEEAGRVDEESRKRLLSSRKLSLVVDLDQTIIHAAVEATIGEWMKDPENPNYEALKDVRSFQLVDDGPGLRGCWYYIKLRPGLEDFLESVAEKYELHVYTMGTRQYAQQIVNLVDPDRKYFGDRILSRDESGSMAAKTLTRIFPVDTKMVVIIDDRGDIWKYSPNLLRVLAFEFFVGIGDINAGFLPKKQEIQGTAEQEFSQENGPAELNGKKEAENVGHEVNGITSAEDAVDQADTSALEQLVAMSGGDNSSIQELQNKTQEETIASQLEDKPLLKLQQQLDEKDAVDAAVTNEPPATQGTDSDSSESSETSTTSSPKPKARHSIFKNDDEELIYLEQTLTAVHERFFHEYDRKRHSTKGGRVAALSGKRKAPLPDGEEDAGLADLQFVPDVKKFLPAMKMKVLESVTIVFSGVVHLGIDIQNADIAIWAKSFGATVTDKVTREVTHVIAARVDPAKLREAGLDPAKVKAAVNTAKVKAAVKRGIKVVSTDWLLRSMQRWKKLDERPFLLHQMGHKDLKQDGSSDVGLQDILDDKRLGLPSEYLLSSSEGDSSAMEETDDDKPRRKKLKLDIDAAGDVNPDEYLEEGSPVTINRDEWDDMDAEFKEFMGDDMESESDTDSVRSDRSLAHRERRAQKRRREDDDGDESGHSDDNDRDRGRARSGGSALKSVANVESSASNTPASTTKSIPEINVEMQQDDEDSDDDLARELQRELEAEEGGQ